MIVKNNDFYRRYINVWDEGALKDAPFITLGVEAILTDYYGDLLDAPPPFPVEKNARILDLGCGWGRVLKPVIDRGGRAVGLDISGEMALLAKNHLLKHRHRPEVLRGDGTVLPFRDNSFDMVYSLLVLQHLSKANGRALIKEVHRVLKPGGVAYLRAPGRFAPENLLFSFLQFFSIHVLRVKDPIRMRFYRVGELKRLCRGLYSGCDITAHEFRPPWNFHTRWTWQYIIIPRRFHKKLREISDRIEARANNDRPFLKNFGVVLMLKAVK
ncbi:MAG TPA: class I SAM-dependent methyltransferase [Spirochaetes bacterium]|nr:class I SAM-dependent methyltransferase [Spirochaetota bacterium]